MKERFFSAVLSLNGLSILIGVTGFVSSWVTLVVDLSQTLSVKWFLGLTVFFIFTIAILIKIIYDNGFKMELMPFEEQVINYIEEGEIFVIRKNDVFTTGNLVGIYKVQSDVVSFCCFGVVDHIQPKIMQIKPLSSISGAVNTSTIHNYIISVKIKHSDVIEQIIEEERYG